MKIYLECKSLLLQKSLEFYLREYLTNKKECDFVVSDAPIVAHRPVFVVSRPFMPTSLAKKLEEFVRDSKPEQIRRDIDALMLEFSDRLVGIFKKYE